MRDGSSEKRNIIAGGQIAIFNQVSNLIHTKFHQLNEVFEIQLGLYYDTWFSDNRYHFKASAGWEAQLWFDQNQFLSAWESSGNTNLNLQGLT